MIEDDGKTRGMTVERERKDDRNWATCKRGKKCKLTTLLFTPDFCSVFITHSQHTLSLS